MTAATPISEFSVEDLRRDVMYSCLLQPGGVDSSDRLDPLGFVLRPAILRRLALWNAEQLDPGATRLVAIGWSALGIALALALEVNLPVTLAHEHQLLGDADHADRAVLIADITRTWRSAERATNDLGAAGADVIQALVVWDRRETQRAPIANQISSAVLLTDDTLPIGQQP